MQVLVSRKSTIDFNSRDTKTRRKKNNCIGFSAYAALVIILSFHFSSAITTEWLVTQIHWLIPQHFGPLVKQLIKSSGEQGRCAAKWYSAHILYQNKTLFCKDQMHDNYKHRSCSYHILLRTILFRQMNAAINSSDDDETWHAIPSFEKGKKEKQKQRAINLFNEKYWHLEDTGRCVVFATQKLIHPKVQKQRWDKQINYLLIVTCWLVEIKIIGGNTFLFTKTYNTFNLLQKVW